MGLITTVVLPAVLPFNTNCRLPSHRRLIRCRAVAYRRRLITIYRQRVASDAILQTDSTDVLVRLPLTVTSER